jgi:flagellar L-ring protein FlgH
MTALALTLVAGCERAKQDWDPEVSGIEMSARTMPEAANIQIPMPAPKNRPAPQRAESASLWMSGSDGFFQDRRASMVGDIVTVNIEIDDRAQFSNAAERSRGGDATVGFPGLLGYGNKLEKILPGITPEDLPPGGDIVNLDGSMTSSGSGTIARNERIELKIAALVVQELPNGSLVVAGRQEVMVNEEVRELRVAGIIEPEEIAPDNTISYDRIAEARITYGGRGQLSRQVRTSYGERAVDVILPY